MPHHSKVSQEPSISVVINTYNRASTIGATLNSFRFLNYSNFEVIVVNGPSTDGTDQVLEGFRGQIRVERCPETNLSMSRNIGIRAAAGDIVVFIDDDGIPEPEWLSRLAPAYESAEVGGAGGFVFNHTGVAWQGQYMTSDRFGHSESSATLPQSHQSAAPGAEFFPSLIGVNSSFRRKALFEIGGFDEFFIYFLDETDVCLRLFDRGYKVVVVPEAYVHHKGAPSVVRNYFMFGRSLTYFAFVSNPRLTPDQIMPRVQHGLDRFRAMISQAHQHKLINDEQKQAMLGQLETGHQQALAHLGSGQPRMFMDSSVVPAESEKFKKFPTLKTRPGQMVICLLSVQFPPGPVGGIGRWTYEMAQGLSALGHDVHVITRTQEPASVNFEDGVWVHRLPPSQTDAPAPIQVPPWIWAWAHAAHQEVKRIGGHHRVDIVVAPLYDLEGLACVLDPELKTVTTLQTTFKTMTESHPEWQHDANFWNGVVLPMIAGERFILSCSKQILSISSAISETVRAGYDLDIPSERIELVPIGIRDQTPSFPSRATSGGVQVLFVGRLEPRKGVDVLLACVPALLERHANLRFVLAGDEAYRLPGGLTYREDFLKRHTNAPWLERVVFAGHVDDQSLYQHYADCDIFVAPSRFESFGIILIEAMMFAKPVVACRSGGMQEIVRVGQTGLLAEPGDASSLEAALDQLICDEPKRRRFGSAGRELFLAEYTRSVMASRLEQWFKRLSGKDAAEPDLRAELLML
ncbi:MAG: glycosyltransferase [Deltaproteobacteria bacterium]|nr:glycosyltransferase [Deltaproteobacteria bacterium]